MGACTPRLRPLFQHPEAYAEWCRRTPDGRSQRIADGDSPAMDPIIENGHGPTKSAPPGSLKLAKVPSKTKTSQAGLDYVEGERCVLFNSRVMDEELQRLCHCPRAPSPLVSSFRGLGGPVLEWGGVEGATGVPKGEGYDRGLQLMR